jgi:hypothetical protein
MLVGILPLTVAHIYSFTLILSSGCLNGNTANGIPKRVAFSPV